MDLVTIIVVLIVLGILVWAVEKYLPIAQPFKGIVIVLIILIGCILLLRAVGVTLR